MNKQDYTHITLPLHQLKTPPLTEEARKIMLRQGCTLVENPDECIVSFPEGTIRTEIFPRMITERYHITLPNCYKLQVVYDRYREISILLYPRE
ncbi:MAG TPA: hypothetical protein DDW33_06545 [Ktedonobacter sp.]|jgi:hypothetical protein|nr:hypothetical protein [Ktedonobacter sp.]